MGAAVQGFVDLTTWYAGLVGGHARRIADLLDESAAGTGTATGDALVGEVVRATTSPMLGWALLLNEVFDAAAVIVDPPEPLRTRESQVFYVPASWDLRRLVAVGPTPEGASPSDVTDPTAASRECFVNGFGEPLDAEIEVVPAASEDDDRLPIKLVARRIRPECVGVYRGYVVPADACDGEEVPVWILVG